MQEEQDKHSFLKHFKLQPNTFMQFVLFTFMIPFMKFGKSFSIKEQHLPQLGQNINPINSIKKMSKLLTQSPRSQTQGITLLKIVFKSQLKNFLIYAFLNLSSSLLALAGPVLTKQIIEYIQSGQDDIYIGIGYTGLCLLQIFFSSLFEVHGYFAITQVGFNWTNGILALIAQKGLRYPSLDLKQYSSGDLQTLAAVDGMRFSFFAFYVSSVLFLPIQILVAIYLMYTAVGISFTAGLLMIGLINVYSYFLSKIIKRNNQKLMRSRDIRNKCSADLVNTIQSIKSNAIQDYYYKKLQKIRNNQLNNLKTQNYGYAASITMMWIGPGLILSASFAMYFLLGKQITASKAFQIISIFTVLNFAIKQLPDSVNSLLQIWVSIKRIQKFLLAEQIDKNHITYDNKLQNAFEIKNGDFSWQIKKQQKKNQKQDVKDTKNKQEKQKQAVINDQLNQSLLDTTVQTQTKQKRRKILSDINFTVQKGQFIVIVGQTKSGKTSLLQVLLNQIKSQNPNCQVKINGQISYCSQKAWILNRTVKQNIILGQPQNYKRLQTALNASCLQDDIEDMPGGLVAQIGQRGLNLSGGQKARLALARAVYKQADIYVLDDILSAVDIHVGKSISQRCLLGMLKGKTRILVTHNLSVCRNADNIILMKDGRITQKGSFQQINKMPLFSNLYQSFMKKQDKHDAKQDFIQNKVKKKQKKDGNSKLMMVQDRYIGQVPYQTYKDYISINGGLWFIGPLIISIASGLISQFFSNIVIIQWCNYPKDYKFLLYYVLLSIGGGLLIGIRSIIMIYSTLRQGRRLFAKMTNSLLNSPMQWWQSIPSGRIMNRLTKDITQVDQILPFTAGWYLLNVVSLIISLGVCVFDSTLWVLVPFSIFILIAYYLKEYYMKSQRELTRLNSITKSPVMSSLKQIVQGLPSIRSLKKQQFFKEYLYQKIHFNSRSLFTSNANQNCFRIVMVLFSFVVTATSISTAIFGSLSGPFVGLLLSYVFTLSKNINGYIIASSNIQNRMIAFQRSQSFANLQPQEGLIKYTIQKKPGTKLFSKGLIQFKQFSMRYRENLPLALNNISIRIQPAQKIGVVGRTGAGKSSLTQVLLRLVEGCSGAVYIDSLPIHQIKTKDLRSEITFVSQQPILINASIRDNLDPTQSNTDSDMIQVMKLCCIDNLLTDRDGLETQITQGGSNLSVGQKQLMCLARAILKKSKVVLIDQATANIDVQTDQIIQKAIKQKFSDSTVITIAHRINTIMHCDRIIVMGSGEISEVGNPKQLIDNGGQFSRLYYEHVHS